MTLPTEYQTNALLDYIKAETTYRIRAAHQHYPFRYDLAEQARTKAFKALTESGEGGQAA